MKVNLLLRDSRRWNLPFLIVIVSDVPDDADLELLETQIENFYRLGAHPQMRPYLVATLATHDTITLALKDKTAGTAITFGELVPSGAVDDLAADIKKKGEHNDLY